MLTQNKRAIFIFAIAASILLLPLIAMQFSNQVNWSAFDFGVAALLLFGTGLVLEIILRTVKTTGRRIALGAVLFVALFLVWAELAVGIFGTPLAGS